MAESTSLEIAIRDPLCEVTRKERRLLLGVSIIGIAQAKTGLVPQKISSLGIEFTTINQKYFLYVVAIVIAYFLVAFMIYSASDFIVWRLAFRSAWRESLSKRSLRNRNDELEFIEKEGRKIDEFMKARFGNYQFIYMLSGFISIGRAVFEFLLPIVVGLYAITSLLIYKVT
jgi:hypothetical protein